jgi:mono/diheme cytochrome c family protein
MPRWGLVLSAAFATGAFASAQVTYSKEIARIFQARCQSCHRAGDIAPFALDSYQSAVWNSRAIERELRSRRMPPWKPVPGFGEFTDPRQMPDEERQVVLDWIASDLPQGEPADLPPPLRDMSEWPLGPPDATLSMLQPFTPPAGAGDVYRCFIIPTGLHETRMLSAIDLMPGSRAIVHHVLLFQDTQGRADALDYRDGQPGYPCFGGPGIPFGDNLFNALTAGLGGWAPGQRAQHLPEGVGIQLHKDARIIMQVHYSPRDGGDADQTRIGLYFSKEPVARRLLHVPVLNQEFVIPPGERRYEVNAELPVPPLLDAKVIWAYPHMHLLGREIKGDVLKPDRSVDPIIWENDWDFHWQGSYTLKEPLAIRAGSTVRLQCIYDNSEENPRNPNQPPKPVGWGEATSDEMCLLFLGVTFDNEPLLSLLLPGF